MSENEHTVDGASDRGRDKLRSARRARPPGVAALEAIDGALGLVEKILLVGFLVVLIAIGASQAIVTQFGKSWMWSEEVICYSVFFIAMTGAALSAQTSQLIAMDFLTRLLPPDRRALLRVLLQLFTVVVCALFVVGGMGLRQAASDESGHVIPPELGLLALPIGAALIGLHVFLHVAVDLLYLLRGRTPPERHRADGPEEAAAVKAIDGPASAITESSGPS